MIVERQQQHGWGDSVVEMLARDLQNAFPKMTGLSKTNLWRARAFYAAYKLHPFLPPAVGEIQSELQEGKMPSLLAAIGWSHNYVIVELCKDFHQRVFYIHMTHRYGWTKNVLIHQIENQTFEKTVVSQQNFEATLPEPLHEQAVLAVKDDYAFGFLELGDQHSEHELEQAILQNIGKKGNYNCRALPDLLISTTLNYNSQLSKNLRSSPITTTSVAVFLILGKVS